MEQEQQEQKTLETPNNLILTKKAVEQTFILKDENPQWKTLSLRVYLEGKGCSGFDYGVTFDESTKEDFTFEIQAEKGSFLLICDPGSFEFMKGSTIDWETIDGESGYLVQNPRHKQFRGKFYKRPFWQEKLKKVVDVVE